MISTVVIIMFYNDDDTMKAMMIANMKPNSGPIATTTVDNRHADAVGARGFRRRVGVSVKNPRVLHEMLARQRKFYLLSTTRR